MSTDKTGDVLEHVSVSKTGVSLLLLVWSPHYRLPSISNLCVVSVLDASFVQFFLLLSSVKITFGTFYCTAEPSKVACGSYSSNGLKHFLTFEDLSLSNFVDLSAS